MLAVADDFGRVQLWPYPCASNKCFDKTYRGHSSHVTNLRYGEPFNLYDLWHLHTHICGALVAHTIRYHLYVDISAWCLVL